MPTVTTWYQENHVIISRVEGEATLQDITAVDAEVVARIRQGSKVTPLVHFILDMRAMTKIPVNLVEIRRALTHLKEPALGWTVVAGMSPVIRFVAGMITQMAGVRFRMVPTLEEAVSFLISQDESLADLKTEVHS
ncbi:MAG: hypothetical protein ABI690_30905 [Chloroflexota bacterium]